MQVGYVAVADLLWLVSRKRFETYRTSLSRIIGGVLVFRALVPALNSLLGVYGVNEWGQLLLRAAADAAIASLAWIMHRWYSAQEAKRA